MSESISSPEDPAERFYQRNFERLVAAGEGECHHDQAAMEGGTHRYSAVFAQLRGKADQIVLEMGYGGTSIPDVSAASDRASCCRCG